MKLFISILFFFVIDMSSESTKKWLEEDPLKDIEKKTLEIKETSILTLTKVYEIVEINFSLLAAALEDLNVARGELLSAKGAFDGNFRTSITNNSGYYDNQRFDSMVNQPTQYQGTSFFAGYRLGAGSFPPYYGERITNQYGEVRAGARIPLIRDREIDKGRAEIKEAEIGMRLADLSVTQQKIEIFRGSALRYWDWIASVERYKVAKTLYEIAKTRQDQIIKRVKAGDIANIEKTDNERIILQREAQLLSAKQFLEVASNELAVFLQKGDGKLPKLGAELIPKNPFQQIPDLVNLDLEKATYKALDKRPELMRLKAQRDQNKVEEELAKNQMKPGVDFIIAGSQDFGPGSVTRSKQEIEATVVLNIPLQTRTQRGKITTLEAKNAKLFSQEKFARDRIEADIKNTYALLEVTRERAKLASKEVELAKKLEKGELDKFILGEGTLILVNIREQTTAEAQVREIDALTDHNKAIIQFQSAILELPPLKK
ncbi:MAG: TolC family protein [Leptospiraceae bacterium]|nr:TolC family protein [Leptospiraceae bacterium]